VDENVSLTMWQKLTTMAPYSTLCAVSRCPVGPLLQAPASRALMLDCMRETAAVARAVGVPMTEAHVQTALGILGGLPDGSTPSMARDFMAGRPSELDAQTGAVVRLASAHGVAAPLLGALHAVLEPQERMHRGELRVADIITHVPVDALPLEYYI
jgi:2-dehydropantoate 2-reductase